MSEYIVDFGSLAMLSRIVESESNRLGEPVVRCRDCRHALVLHPLNPITGVPAGIEDWRCDHFWNADELPEVEPDGFCAWACRKEVRDE